MSYVMYDSVTVSEIPAHAQAVAGYTSGMWPTWAEVLKGWPHAQKLSIAINVAHDADCLDVERGDASPGEAPGWVKRQHARGLKRPVVYCSASVVPSVVAALQGAGIHRGEYRLWSAHYTFHPHICGPSCLGAGLQADATQWTDRALGRNLDESLCNDAFFTVVSRLAVLTAYERSQVELYDRLNARRRWLHPVGLRRVRGRLVTLRKEVWLAAHHEIRAGKTAGAAWSFRHRGARYALLLSRTHGLG